MRQYQVLEIGNLLETSQCHNSLVSLCLIASCYSSWTPSQLQFRRFLFLNELHWIHDQRPLRAAVLVIRANTRIKIRSCVPILLLVPDSLPLSQPANQKLN